MKGKSSLAERDQDTLSSFRIAERIERLDLGVDVLTERVFETLQIDGQTHPSKSQVKRKVNELYARDKRKQRNTPAHDNKP